MSELKPCPFCGDSAVPYHDAEDGGWGVICTNQKCECNLDRYATRDSAEAAWNRRAQLAAAPTQGEQQPCLHDYQDDTDCVGYPCRRCTKCGQYA